MKNKKLQCFISEFLPAIVLTVISLITYLILTLTKFKYSSNTQVLLYAVMCWIPAFFYLITGFRFRLPTFLKIMYFVYLFFSNYLGTTFNLYTYIPFFDTILHASFGYIFGYAIIFILLLKNDYGKISFPLKAVLIFLAIGGIGAVWECAEYIMDVFTGSNSQHEIETQLLDTMQDTFCNLAGACLFIMHLSLDHFVFNDKFFNKIIRIESTYIAPSVIDAEEKIEEKIDSNTNSAD